MAYQSAFPDLQLGIALLSVWLFMIVVFEVFVWVYATARRAGLRYLEAARFWWRAHRQPTTSPTSDKPFRIYWSATEVGYLTGEPSPLWTRPPATPAAAV